MIAQLRTARELSVLVRPCALFLLGAGRTMDHRQTPWAEGWGYEETGRGRLKWRRGGASPLCNP